MPWSAVQRVAALPAAAAPLWLAIAARKAAVSRRSFPRPYAKVLLEAVSTFVSPWAVTFWGKSFLVSSPQGGTFRGASFSFLSRPGGTRA
jgi:hypothetical protein